jgi:protease-4
MVDLYALAAEMAGDPRPRGLIVTLRSLEGGMATVTALREVLSRVRKAGRRVVVHVPSSLDTKGYLVASGADALYAFPGASVSLLGFASRGVFVRGALAKAGVVADVLARGKYKSAGDALTRDEMSEPQREQAGAILDLFYATLTTAMREGRGLGAEQAAAAVDRAIYRAPEAVAAKLIDAALFDDQILTTLAEAPGGPASPSAPPCVAADRYVRARRATSRFRRSGPCVGVIRVHGAISQGGGAFASRGASGSAIVAATRAARESKRVRGVLLHVDSPGGSALASAQMHRELELLAAEKPLVVCMSNVAASGGYYVAAPAHAIVAQPVTITGSIGVISARFALGPILERLGVRTDVLKRGLRADLADPTRALTEEERAALAQEIEGTYQEFIDVVARGRKKSRDEVEALAQGRVWTGRDAHARGLVDQLGGFEVALEEVRRRVGKGGAGLEPREIFGRARGQEPSLADARPAEAPAAIASLASELLGEWADVVPLALSLERVLAWEPAVMGFR